uniref:Immunoglobulin superfamily member 9 n=1 Tax=Varanus komodoensis TaxID=61221 RepID=A0A8D2JG04_VARKO
TAEKALLWVVTLLISFKEAGNGEAEPRAVIGRTGESTILGCDLLKPAEASPPLYVIEWVRFGFPLPIFIKFGLYSPRVDPEYVGRVRIQEGASLRIEQLRTEDQGWYECRVLFLNRPSSDDEFKNGTWIHLTVNSPPAFQETPPAFVEVQNQKPVALTCLAAGNPQPMVTWKRDNQAIKSGDKVQVKNGTLFFASVDRASAGAYTCQATSEEGSITHTTRLLVQGPPVIVVPPQNITVNVTQDAFLACQAEAYPANLTYSWFQGSTNVFHIGGVTPRNKPPLCGSLSLLRLHLCTCVMPPPSCLTCLTPCPPTDPARAGDMPPETLLPIGMRGTIRCPAKASPPLLFINWTKDGQPLELDKFPGWSMSPDGTLVIATSNDDALGVYACIPYNSYGTAGSSAPTQVLLKDPPVFTLRPKEEYFQEVGRELLIPCAARGDPTPVLSWTKVSKTLANAQADSNGSLVLRPLTKEQHGLWECVANNGVAQVSAVTTVYVLGTSPHTVANVSVLPLQQAVNITWEPGFDGGYFQRFSIWYTPLLKRFNRPHHDWVSLPVPAGASHILVENLQPDTGYQFSVLAQNKLGSGPFSEIVTTVPLGEKGTVPSDPPTTQFQIFLSPPQSLTANETTRGVLLLWEPPYQFSVALTGYALELRQDQGAWEVLERAIPSSETQFLVPGLIKDAFYEFRLVAFAGNYISDPSNAVNVSTTGMEVYPSRTQLPELLPQPVLAGVIGGVCFLSTAVIFSTVAACIMNRRRAARLRKRRQDPPIVFSPNKKLLPSQNSTGSASPDSVVKPAFQTSPCQSLRRTLLWGEKASREERPRERLAALEPVWQRTKASGYCQGRYFDYSSSSPTEEAMPLCIANISPVATVWLGGPGILQYLSLPFFKEMNVDGDWPPEEDEGGGKPPSKPALPEAPVKAALPGSSLCPSRLGSSADAPQPMEHDPWLRTLSPKLLRGSLTSQSSGRGSVSFLRPPSLAPSLAGSCLSSPFGEVTGWQGSCAGDEGKPKREPSLVPISKRRNTSVDENYEWDTEFALESDLLDALQLFRSGNPKRPVSTIAAHELENPEERCAALREEFLAYRRRREAIQQRRRKLGSGEKQRDERFEQATLL